MSTTLTDLRDRRPLTRAEFVARERVLLSAFERPRERVRVRYECQACGRSYLTPAAVYDHDCAPLLTD